MNTFRTQYPTRKQYKTSVYYLWFEFLKRSDPKKWSRKVRADFGDISNIDFMDWWEANGRFLFYSWPDIAVMNVSCPESAQEALKRGWLVVSINKNEPVIQIMDQFKRYIDNRIKFKRGSRKFKADRGADYVVRSKFDIFALQKTLKVYDLAIKEPELPLWKIEERLNLIDKKSKRAGDIWSWGNSLKELAAKKKVQTVTVSRYFRHAEEIIENVAKGEFPVHS